MSEQDLPPEYESTLQYVEYLLACSEQSPATFVKPSFGLSSKSKSIHQKLTDLYIEESLKQPEAKNVVYASHLLAKLAKKERLNCMVLSLYPGNEGYSIMLRSRSGVESETMKLPYEESEILEFVDTAQLPPFLLDLLEKAQVNVFYSGCVIVEVRDYRRSTTGSYDTNHVLLRPSPQSLLRDVSAISCDGHTWTQDDLFHLESELILATAEPLCLDPSPAVMLVENAVQYEGKFLNNPALRRSMKKYTEAAVNRKRKLFQSSTPDCMRLHDFAVKKKEKSKPSTGLLKGRWNIDIFKEATTPILTTPETVEVKKYMKVPEVPPTNAMIFVEEHTLERDPTHSFHMMARINIYQPQFGDSYYGEFYLDHKYCQAKTYEDGRRCRFELGTRQKVDRYLKQFKDMFTEDGNVQVKIAVRHANEAVPSITYTQGMPANHPAPPTLPTQKPTAIGNAQPQGKLMAFPKVGTKPGDMGLVASLAAKRNIPIQLKMSINPATGNMASSQASAGISTSPFLTSPLPTASALAAQRLKASASGTSQLRSSSSPTISPAINPRASTSHQVTLPANIPLLAITKPATPNTAVTPPKSRTPTPTHTPAGSRLNAAATDLNQPGSNSQQQQQQQQQALQHQNLSNFLQGLTSTAAIAKHQNTAQVSQQQQQNSQQQQQQQQQQQSSGLANISISNLNNLQSNFNLQGLTGLPGVNIANLSGLQHMQVSLAQIAVPVPVPISLINSNTNLLQTQQDLQANATSSSSAGTLVTMVSALPSAASSIATSTASITSQDAMPTGPPSNPSPVLPKGSTTGMLSIPVGLSGLSQTIRSSTPVPLLQLQGQQGIQLVSVQPQRSQGKTGNPGPTQGGMTRFAQAGTSSVPLSVLSSQQMTALAVSGKPNQSAGTTSITPQQLIQLTGGSGATLSQDTSQRATHLSFGKGRQGLQLHSLQLKPGNTTSLSQVQSSGVFGNKTGNRPGSGGHK